MDEIDAELCRRSFYHFVQTFWDVIVAEPPVWNWHIPYLCNELEAIIRRVAFLNRAAANMPPDIRRLPKLHDYDIINIPPGSSKSTIVTVMLPLWGWTIDPTLRVICGSYASTPAEDLADKAYKIFTSDRYARLFPHLVAKASGGKTKFSNGLLGERYTTSTGSAITGVHAHIILLDDPMNPEIAASEKERTSANKWVSETVSTRKVDQAVTVTCVIMQRLHEMDTTGYLLSKKGLSINHICLPIQVSPHVKPAHLAEKYIDGAFDPIRRPLSSLAAVKEDLGSYGYAGQMEQLPAPLDGGLIKKAWFPIILPAELPPGLTVNFQIDGAYTQKQKNDPSAGMAYAVDDQWLYILNSQSVFKEFPALCEWIVAWTEEYGYSHKSRIWVEPKATGKTVVQQIRQTTGLNIMEDEVPKDDKVTRVNAVSAKIEAGRVKMVQGHWNESFLNQCAAFPNGAHDDEVDNLSAVIKRELNKQKFRVLVG